jgi:hypothetical protein
MYSRNDDSLEVLIKALFCQDTLMSAYRWEEGAGREAVLQHIEYSYRFQVEYISQEPRGLKLTNIWSTLL